MAVTEYTDQTFFEITGVEKHTYSFLRLFNTLLDSDRETKFLNIFRSYISNEDIFRDVSLFETYEVANGEYWDNVSYNLYETPYLWWVIALLNNIVNPFEELEDGDQLNVLRTEYVYQLTTDLEKIAED
jgi:hypothetical protein